MADNLPNKVLIIDDDQSVYQGMVGPLSKHDIAVIGAHDLETAMYHFNQQRFEVVVVEQEFEFLPGLAIVQKWRQHEVHDKRTAGFIVATGTQRSPGDQALLMELGSLEFIQKPYSGIQLLPYIARAFSLRKQTEKYEEIAENIRKLSKQPGKEDKALDILQQKMGDLGAKGAPLMVDIMEDLKRYDDALVVVDKLLNNNPNAINWLNVKGRILLKKGQPEDALKFMERADEVAPGNIERINDMAVMYLDLKDPDKSSTKMKQLIDLNPENPEMRFDLFSKLFDCGYDEHAQELCKATTSPIEVVRYYNNKGVALAKAGRVDEAILEYERSLTYFPKFKENYRIHYNICLAYLGKKSREAYERALVSANKALQLKPGFEKAASTKASIEEALGKAGKSA